MNNNSVSIPRSKIKEILDKLEEAQKLLRGKQT